MMKIPKKVVVGPFTYTILLQVIRDNPDLLDFLRWI